MNQRITSAIAFSLVTSGIAVAQNDDCSGALTAVAGAATAFDTTAATSSVEAWPCALGGNDIWYTYTPTMSGGSVSIETCGSSYDTALEIFTGTCGALTPFTCNDDACGLQSQAQFGPTTAGTPIYFRIGGFNGATGTGTFLLNENPPGMGADECAGAVALTSGTAVAFDTTTATQSPTPWPCAGSGGPDLWYEFTSTIPNGLITVETCGSSYDTALEIFSGSCGALVSETCNDDFCGLQSTASAFTGAAGTTYYVRVGGFAGSTGLGTILLTESTNPCTGQMDDSFEDNDVCTSPTQIMSGNNVGLFASVSDPDFYEVTLQPNEILVVGLIDTLNEDLDLNQYDATCGLVTFWNTDGFTYQNTTGSAETVIFEVFLDPLFSGLGCLNYDMDISITTGPDCSTPDAFESNLDCTSATPLGDGSYMGLNVDELDQDYYEIGLDDGATVTIDIFFLNSFADVDLYLWDPNVACDTNVAGQGTGTGALAVGFSASDNESISYTNTTGGPQTLIVEVDMFTAGGCNEYDLSIAGSNGMGGQLGTNYCMANANSTGGTGTMSAMGSRVVSNNDVMITASGLPNSAFGFFIVSQTQGFVPNPNGSDGNLCLGGAIGRYVGPGEIMNTQMTGEFSLTLDLTMTPQPTGFVSIMGGETWNYQAWHRDVVNGNVTSNFTDGLSIQYL